MGGRVGEESGEDCVGCPGVGGGDWQRDEAGDAGQHPDLGEDAEVGALVGFFAEVGHYHHLWGGLAFGYSLGGGEIGDGG